MNVIQRCLLREEQTSDHHNYSTYFVDSINNFIEISSILYQEVEQMSELQDINEIEQEKRKTKCFASTSFSHLPQANEAWLLLLLRNNLSNVIIDHGTTGCFSNNLIGTHFCQGMGRGTTERVVFQNSMYHIPSTKTLSLDALSERKESTRQSARRRK